MIHGLLALLALLATYGLILAVVLIAAAVAVGLLLLWAVYRVVRRVLG